LEATTAARPKDLEGSISLLGSKGTAEIGGRCLNELKSLWVDGQNLMETTPLPPPDGHISYLKAVVRSISSATTPEVDGLEGMKSVRILDAMYRSMREEKRVFI
jgi:predicted dehydrogenase